LLYEQPILKGGKISEIFTRKFTVLKFRFTQIEIITIQSFFGNSLTFSVILQSDNLQTERFSTRNRYSTPCFLLALRLQKCGV